MKIRAVNCQAHIQYKNGKTYFAVNTNHSNFNKVIKIIYDEPFTADKSSNSNYVPMTNLSAVGNNECIIIPLTANKRDTFKIQFTTYGNNAVKNNHNNSHNSAKQMYKSIANIPGVQLPKDLFAD